MTNLIDVFSQIYLKCIGNNTFLNKYKIYSILRYIIKVSGNYLLPIYFYFTRSKYNIKVKKIFNDKSIIVSLTSFPDRISKVYLVIESLLRQKKQPDRIILYLSKDQFSEISILPKKLKNLINRGLEIKLVEGDIKPHKKYYYSMIENPNNIIVTIDDDLMYPSNLIEELFLEYQNHPKDIICNAASFIKFDSEGNIMKYSDWDEAAPYTASSNNFLIGCGGVLYPPNSLSEEYQNMDLFMKLCPLADDIWLNVMAKLNGTKIYKTSMSRHMFPIIYIKPNNLHTTNVGENRNDRYIKNIRNHFLTKLNLDIFRP